MVVFCQAQLFGSNIMEKKRNWLSSIIQSTLDNILESASPTKRYRRLRLTLLFAMVGISMIPLINVAGLGYFEYQDLLQQSEKEQLQWNLEIAKKSIEAYVGKLQSVLNFVARGDRYEELLTQDAIEDLFVRLQIHCPCFVDLGVIDSTGMQRTYVGPYNLLGKNYHEQEWFHHTLTSEVYISNVFLGYREIPHFVMAVSNQIADSDAQWVLRVTINAETLQQFISEINTKAADDIFIVGENDVLQTTTVNYGNVLESYSAPDKTDDSILQAFAPLENTTWKLVLIKKGYIHGDDWASFQQRLLIIFVSFSAICLYVSFVIVAVLIGHLRSSDKRNRQILSKAEHTNKLASIGRLATGVAHEVNNPLAVIQQNAGLIQDLLEMVEKTKYSDTVDKSLLAVQNAVNRCKVITHRLLGFARRMDVSLEDIDVNDVLKEVLGFLDKEAMYNYIKIETRFLEDLPLIHSDRGQLQQVFLNITNNAIDAIGKDGTILICSGMNGANHIEVEICDSGSGIDSDVVEHIFEPFYTTKEVGKGTGLGLSITYGLVKQLGGQLKVDSIPDTGTIFTVILPIKYTE
jgi:two-component system, NtrC family, sensor kinase